MTQAAIAHYELDPELCHRAVKSRDHRFDGMFYTAVRSTGIYCRPSCPARTPSFANVTFHPTAASAQAAGYRACKRCVPDATPGSPEWDVSADVAGRAMRLIADGVVDREGVSGLAAHLGFSTRHLNRLLVDRLGAGPLALARARRAQTARTLITGSAMSFADVAFAAGFASVRQFNDTVRAVYAVSPTEMRGEPRGERPPFGTLTIRLSVRTPFAGRALLSFLGARAIPGVEVVVGDTWARTLRLPHGHGTVTLELADQEGSGSGFVPATFALEDLRDTTAAVERTRRVLDADCDPVAISDQLGTDPLIGSLVRSNPGLRVPGHVDGAEVAVRAVLGQQVTIGAARTLAARLVHAYGEPVKTNVDGLTHLFPTSQAIAALHVNGEIEGLAMPRMRGRALVAIASALADGTLCLDRGVDRTAARESLLELPGIGPWTADYIGMRALGHPDLFLPSDTGTRDALRRRGQDPTRSGELAERWRPWRSYAQVHLWQSLQEEK